MLEMKLNLNILQLFFLSIFLTGKLHKGVVKRGHLKRIFTTGEYMAIQQNLAVSNFYRKHSLQKMKINKCEKT